MTGNRRCRPWRTAQIRLKQIPFACYHEFFPDKSRRELIEMYAVTGGVPKYIELFSESRDIYSAIDSCVLNRSGYLYDEPHFLLQQEVSEVGSYFSVSGPSHPSWRRRPPA